jgi:catechol 2,3-dioxygenase-like lactoylglutathione lyase family enzyme
MQGQADSRPRLIGLAHMTFQSSDIEKALEFYRGVLGWEDIVRMEGSGKLERALARINGRQWIELRPELTPRSDRLVDFGFLVEDAEAMRAYLGASGMAVPPSASTGATGNLGFSVEDPDGHRVWFTELLPGGWPAREAGKAAGLAPMSACMMHLGFDVRSMEASMAFYRDILGCVEFWRGSDNGRTLSWVQLKLPEDPKGNYIEFMLSERQPSLEDLGVFNHFGIEVASMHMTMEEASRRLSERPYPRAVEYSIGTCRHRLANVYDPDGSRAEFMERGTFDGSVTPSSSLPPPRRR